MDIFNIEDIEEKGLPLYKMKNLFNLSGDYSDISFSLITLLPGQRVPEKGTGSHLEDEYSYFLKGEVYTESGEDKITIGEGMCTLIPKGEEHWCINNTNEDCVLVCMMVK